jgi:guanine deaminase
VHLDGDARGRLAAGGGAAAFCPTSNLFLGSGLFDLAAMNRSGVRVGLATDVGGGTSLSMFRTMAAAYEVLKLRGQNLPAEEALYLATLGAARALGLDAEIGSFEAGKEADFIIVDPTATRLSERRWRQLESIGERLFALIMLGDDRHVAATYVDGHRMPNG